MKTVVLIPYRPDNGHRDRLWQFLKTNYWHGWEVIEGQSPAGPFNRSAAINQAAQQQNWDVAIIADADTWVPNESRQLAIDLAAQNQKLVAAFNAVVELSQECTEDILTGKIGFEGSFGATKVRTRQLETQSSMLAIHRTLWDKVGGFDERFAGWGGEDNAFWKACKLHAAGWDVIPGNAYHLWHPDAPNKRKAPEYHRNLRLWQRYKNAKTVEDLP